MEALKKDSKKTKGSENQLKKSETALKDANKRIQVQHTLPVCVRVGCVSASCEGAWLPSCCAARQEMEASLKEMEAQLKAADANTEKQATIACSRECSAHTEITAAG